MTIRATTWLVLTGLLFASPSSAQDLESDEDWVKAVRGSGSYQQGLRNVRNLLDSSYDVGALKGAAHWEDVHSYFLELARAKGCKRGMPYAEGPVKVCHKVSGKEPPITGSDYKAGLKKVTAMANETLYPDIVRPVLKSLYDYGYVQGMRHGVRVHNDNIRLAQTYYRACMERVSVPNGEKSCASGSKQWSEALVERLRKRIEAHGLPAGKAP